MGFNLVLEDRFKYIPSMFKIDLFYQHTIYFRRSIKEIAIRLHR